MPAAVFPRTLPPTSVTPMSVPTGLVSVGHTGKAQLRSVVALGRSWTETWAGLRAGSQDVETFLAWIEWAYSTSRVFTIEHLTTPGSGIAPIGSGGGIPLILGGSQTGESLSTDGWPISINGVVRAGDMIKVAGINTPLRVTADATSDGAGQATLSINPPIPVGNSPADNAAISYGHHNAVFNAYISSPPNLPEIPKTTALVFTGLSLSFREAIT